ncbi:hypothetical protein GF420_04140 [candidate division GN15 bacterium]|nr:hypothetical protein [candidate division GN15 bacterium]
MTTIAAGPFIEDVPYTIGMRADYVQIVPFARDKMDENYSSLPVDMVREKALEAARQAVNQMGVTWQGDFGRNRTELLHPDCSLIFFPYVSVEMQAPRYYRFLVDGLTGRVLHFCDDQMSQGPTIGESQSPGVELGELTVSLHRCFNCGSDLPRGRSFVYICDNCHVVNTVDGRGLDVDELQWVEPAAGSTDSLFPFWTFDLGDQDSADVARLFGGIHQSGRLVIPALRMPNFEAAFRLTQRISAAIGQFETVPVDLYNERFRPVTLSPAEARLYAEIMIYRARVKRATDADITQVEFAPTASSIVYLPFQEQAYFYVDSVLNAVTFEKNLVG